MDNALNDDADDGDDDGDHDDGDGGYDGGDDGDCGACLIIVGWLELTVMKIRRPTFSYK